MQRGRWVRMLGGIIRLVVMLGLIVRLHPPHISNQPVRCVRTDFPSSSHQLPRRPSFLPPPRNGRSCLLDMAESRLGAQERRDCRRYIGCRRWRTQGNAGGCIDVGRLCRSGKYYNQGCDEYAGRAVLLRVRVEGGFVFGRLVVVRMNAVLLNLIIELGIITVLLCSCRFLFSLQVSLLGTADILLRLLALP